MTEISDRYVLMGNHRDAWSLGAVEPTGGTAIMMEVSRILASLTKEGLFRSFHLHQIANDDQLFTETFLYLPGWRPRKTIVFCSWGAEEYGIIGSYEWVEVNGSILCLVFKIEHYCKDEKF